ncbi:MAG: hypothetical protein LBC95_01155 [Candidatus Nomurabacteria bacterium]|jgi:hypothetical protein|nr:hypothetical protein [Candidatus Nomurabacteria bacterium]
MTSTAIQKYISQATLPELTVLEKLINKRRELDEVKAAAKRARSDLTNGKTHSLTKVKAELSL